MKLTLAQAATRWGWSRSRMYRQAVIEKRIPCVRIGGSWFFDGAELDAWWTAQSTAHVARDVDAPQPAARDRRNERAALGLPDRHLFVS